MAAPLARSAGLDARAETDGAAPVAPIAAGGGAQPGAERRAMLALLQLEAEIREISSERELFYRIANATRSFTQAQQVFVFGAGSRLRLTSISGLAAVDPSAPLVNDIQAATRRLVQEATEKDASIACNIAERCGDGEQALAAYPYPFALWVPFRLRNGQLLGGMLLTRHAPFSDAARTTALRLGKAYAHAFALLLTEPGLARRLASGFARKRIVIAAVVTLVAAVLCAPVSMSTVAPVEIIPSAPFVVAAPIEGVIENVAVEPSETVRAGQTVVTFNDVVLKNRLEVAAHDVRVARAQLEKATQQAFDDPQGRHEIGIAAADLELKEAKHAYAKDLLARSTIRAPRQGVAIFADRRELLGKPVAVGERIMEIADPGLVEVEIMVPVDDTIILRRGARVKVFLDAAPLDPREAEVVRADYRARTHDNNVLSFRVVARFVGEEAPPRLGGRGTGQLFGEQVPLAFYLFRRPLSAVRQWFGL